MFPGIQRMSFPDLAHREAGSRADDLSLFLAAAFAVSIEVYRQVCNCLGQNPHAGIDRRHLHGGALRYSLAGGRPAEEEAVGASGC